MVRKALRDHQEKVDLQVPGDQMGSKENLENWVLLVQQEYLVMKDPQDPLVNLGWMVMMVNQVKLEKRGKQVLLVNQDLWEFQVSRDYKV